jgi:hypothetical protein
MGPMEWVCNKEDKWIACSKTKYLILDREDTPYVETSLVLFLNVMIIWEKCPWSNLLVFFF